MKNIRNMLLGVVVIGGLMFVGCTNQGVSEDTTIKDDVEEEYDNFDPAVLKYGEDLTLNEGKFKLKDYMTEEEINNITIGRYDKATGLLENCFDTEYERKMIIKYLKGESTTLPNGTENIHEDDEDTIQNAIDNSKDTNKIQQEPTKRCCKCGKVMTTEQIKLYGDTCTDCLTDTCEYCGTEKPLDSQCPNCGGMDNNLERLPYHTKYIHCDNCGNQTFDWINGVCIECGYTE